MHFIKKGNSNTNNLAYTSLVRPILEYGAACWDSYREAQINVLDRVLKKTSKFANHMNDSLWETLAQRWKLARICFLFKAYCGERTWKAIGGTLQGPYYLSRDDHDRKIRARKQRTVIKKYSFVNRTIKLWNQLAAEVLATFPCRSYIFKKRCRTVITSEVIWSEVRWSEGIWRVMIKFLKFEDSEKWGVKWIEVKWRFLVECVYFHGFIVI